MRDRARRGSRHPAVVRLAEIGVPTGARDSSRREGSGVIADNVNGPYRHVLPLDDAEQIDKRRLPLHREPETHIFAMLRVSAPVAVQHEAVTADRVVVGARFPGLGAPDSCCSARAWSPIAFPGIL